MSGAPTGWKATLHGGGFVVSGVTVADGKAGTARLDVKVPADTTATEGRMVVTARLGSDVATLPITVGVNADVAGDITLSYDVPDADRRERHVLQLHLTLNNGSAQDQTVSATATGPAGWTVDDEAVRGQGGEHRRQGRQHDDDHGHGDAAGRRAGRSDRHRRDGHGRHQDDPRHSSGSTSPARSR